MNKSSTNGQAKNTITDEQSYTFCEHTGEIGLYSTNKTPMPLQYVEIPSLPPSRSFGRNNFSFLVEIFFVRVKGRSHLVMAVILMRLTRHSLPRA